jgi:hypothetical protein
MRHATACALRWQATLPPPVRSGWRG